jgi:uncharacterized protein (TIGR03067 family)
VLGAVVFLASNIGENMGRAYTSCVVVAFLLSLAAYSQERNQIDKDRLQGVWLEEAGEVDGKKFDGRLRLEFSGVRFKLQSKDGTRMLYEGTFVLDEKTTPSQIVGEVSETGTPGVKFEVEFPGRIVGIYEVDKDTLKLCWGGSPRPTEFASKNKFHVYSLFKREMK